MAADPVRILIIDGHSGATAQLAALLQPRLQTVPGRPAWQVVVVTGPDAVPPPVGAGQREVLVVTRSWPDRAGAGAGAGPVGLPQVLDRAEDRPVLLACLQDDPAAALAAVQAGAQEVLHLEGLRPETLAAALERALARAARLAEQRRARLAAEATARTRGDLLTVLAHEFRTPLAGLIGLADRLGVEPLTATQAELVGQIGRCGQELLGLIENVLEQSRVEAGRQVLEPTDFHLPELIDEVVGLLRPLAQAKGLCLGAQVAVGLAPERRGDRRRLRQVLLNLVGNAIKFTDHGGVTLDLTADPGHPDGVILGVHDTGIGIALDQQPLLFLPYARALDDTIQREGAGLGLPISRELVELMGGRLDVESQPGLGSTFRIHLPLPLTPAVPAVALRSRPSTADARQPAPHLPLGASASRAAVGSGSGSGRERLRVLVAEDHAVNRQVLRLLLEQAGASVREVGSGTDAVRTFQAEPFDLVILDLNLPGLNGFDAARAIRQHESTRPEPALSHALVPIVAATAHTGDEIRTACLTYGFDGLLTKPVTAAALAPWLQKARTRPATAEPATLPLASGPGSEGLNPARAGGGYQGQQLIDFYGGDPLLASELAQAFLLEAPELLHDLAEAFRTGDLAGLAALAHGLKGMALTIAAFGLADLIGALQQAAEHGERATAQRRLEAVQRHWVRLRHELQTLAALGDELTASGSTGGIDHAA